MQEITFTKHYQHRITPESSHYFDAGQTVTVPKTIADAARSAGVIEERNDVGESDKGSAPVSSDTLEE